MQSFYCETLTDQPLLVLITPVHNRQLIPRLLALTGAAYPVSVRRGEAPIDLPDGVLSQGGHDPPAPHRDPRSPEPAETDDHQLGDVPGRHDQRHRSDAAPHATGERTDSTGWGERGLEGTGMCSPCLEKRTVIAIEDL